MVSQHSPSAVPCGGGFAGPRRNTKESIAQSRDVLKREFTALFITEGSAQAR